ncbi:uncharacterized protein METZ01_LOCUS139424 [marine metagenome]|uniref:Uncharacterized protein n=1 Tax=marine metagenome TaxID=408172 RepID=A0A381ZBI2_9ZZZZ
MDIKPLVALITNEGKLHGFLGASLN